MIDRLTEAFDMLLTMPLAGRLRQEFRENLRSFAVDNYVIFYIPQSAGIDIIRVMHGRRDIGPADVEYPSLPCCPDHQVVAAAN
jgi:toxin ParE1/3/4